MEVGIFVPIGNNSEVSPGSTPPMQFAGQSLTSDVLHLSGMSKLGGTTISGTSGERRHETHLK